jgi:hypothetical protein
LGIFGDVPEGGYGFSADKLRPIYKLFEELLHSLVRVPTVEAISFYVCRDNQELYVDYAGPITEEAKEEFLTYSEHQEEIAGVKIWVNFD